MEIREQINENYTTLYPIGELDANSSIHLDEKIASMIQNGRVNIHVNCKDIAYMSSAGLGVFISHLEEISMRSGKLILSNLSPGVFDVFDLLGLNQLVTIAENSDDIGKYF